ncbi:MAG: Asp-tRNA(Asn)/Glu-tRNA(Gln) amidotransferase subunit GatB [bacterium]
MEYEALIGLEVHVQLSTKSKIFCGCSTEFGAPPNTQVCPVCLGLPGVLPVLNRKAVEYAIMTALALNCEIRPYNKFARKNYFYPDLPKNFQISQYDEPLAQNGHLEIELDGKTKRIRIRRVHMEEDAGKLVHPENRNVSYVDWNRTGVPLLEIVSEPDMNSAEEALAYAHALHQLVRWLGVSEANMQMGHMRFEPNINLHITYNGRMYKTPIIEVKNLNSFRALERTIVYEIRRQYGEWQSNPEGYTLEKLGKQNRGYDDVKEQTVFQRGKEEAHDYRYFPEPDLVELRIDEEWIEEVRRKLPELPAAKRRRFIEQYKLSPYDAGVLTASRDMADYFEKCVGLYSDPKAVANWVMGDLSALLKAHDQDITQTKVSPQHLTNMLKMIEDGTISGTIAKEVLADIFETGDPPERIVEKKGLVQISDEDELGSIIDKVIARNEKIVSDFKGGKDKALGALIGQVMKATKGKANPQLVNKIIREKLGR